MLNTQTRARENRLWITFLKWVLCLYFLRIKKQKQQGHFHSEKRPFLALTSVFDML